MIIKKVKTMAIKKNKKRFDPRYFMDEKTEQPINESRQIEKTIDDSGARDEYLRRKHEEAEREKATRRSKEGPVDNNVVRHTTADHSVDHSLEEGDLSHLADPAVWEALGQGLAHLAKIWVPLIGTAGFAIVAKDAIEYLKGGSKLEDALQQAAAKAESGQEEELNEINEPTVFLSQLKARMEQEGLYSEEDLQNKISAMAELMSPNVIDAMQIVANNAQAVGDIHMKMGATLLSDKNIGRLEPETKTLLRILKVLGKYQREWDR